MQNATQDGGPRGTDRLGIALLGALALFALSAAWLVVSHGYLTAGALVGLAVVGGAVVVLHGMGSRVAPPKNTEVHGAARPASEQEAQRAGRGQAQGARLDDRTF
jgi:hypothetical protein